MNTTYFYECISKRANRNKSSQVQVKMIKDINAINANEYEISKRLCDHSQYFYCVTSMQILKQKELDETISNKFIFTYNFSPSMTLQAKTARHTVHECINEYIHILKSLQHLQNLNIAFCNVDKCNIVFFGNSRPVLQNFQFAITTTTSSSKKKIDILRPFLPPEVVKEEDVRTCLNNKGLSGEFIEKSYESFMLQRELFQISDENVVDILRKWDIYSLSMMYITILHELFLRNYNDNESEKSFHIFPTDKTIIHFYHVLMQNINVNYMKRWTIAKTINYLSLYY
jgi:hypothetical protein